MFSYVFTCIVGIDVPHASRWFDWDQTYLADVEFALHPLYDWEKHTAESGKEEGGGAITTLPEEAHIHLTPSQSVYHFSSPRMRLCTPGQTGVTKRRKQVHSVPFTVDEESIAFVEVHYDFLENHLLLSLEGKEHRTGMLRSLHGSPRVRLVWFCSCFSLFLFLSCIFILMIISCIIITSY